MVPRSRISRETASHPSPSEGASTTTIPTPLTVPAQSVSMRSLVFASKRWTRVGLDPQPDPAASGRDARGVDPRDHVGAVGDLLHLAEGSVDVGVGAELLDRLDGHLEPLVGVADDLERLGAEAEHDAAAVGGCRDARDRARG